MAFGTQDLQHPINYATLHELEESVAGGTPDIIVDLIDTYISDSQATFGALSHALSQADCKRIELSAHSLKSSSATFGAESLAAFFGHIEQLARDGNVDTIATLLADAQQKLTDVERALIQERQRIAHI